jgi:hypothetical protein
MFRRNVQLDLQPMLVEFQEAYTRVALKLPTSTTGLDHQMTEILTARRCLLKLHKQVQHRLMKDIPPQMRQQLHTLLHGTGDLLHIAENLTMLAEEYPIDPDGSIACLQGVNSRKATLLQQMQRSLVTLPAGCLSSLNADVMA